MSESRLIDPELSVELQPAKQAVPKAAPSAKSIRVQGSPIGAEMDAVLRCAYTWSRISERDHGFYDRDCAGDLPNFDLRS
jgi:hypothetical protein